MAVNASFNVKDFEALIESQGYNAYWSQAIVCECMKDGQPDMHCEFCSGRGWRYLPKRGIKAVTTSLTGDRDLHIQGFREPGTAYITPQNGIIMGYNDKVEFYEITCNHSQTIIMGKDNTSSTYRPIKKVLFVVQGQHVFEEKKDFVITEDSHHLEWMTDDYKPELGSKISILYLTSPEYLVTDLLHELRSTRQSKGTRHPYTEELPKQYQIKRVDFVYGHTINAKLDKDTLQGEEWTYE